MENSEGKAYTDTASVILASTNSNGNMLIYFEMVPNMVIRILIFQWGNLTADCGQVVRVRAIKWSVLFILSSQPTMTSYSVDQHVQSRPEDSRRARAVDCGLEEISTSSNQISPALVRLFKVLEFTWLTIQRISSSAHLDQTDSQSRLFEPMRWQ